MIQQHRFLWSAYQVQPLSAMEVSTFVCLENSLTKQILRTPLGHVLNNWQHAVTNSSQIILHLWRNDLIFSTINKTKCGESFQFATQYARSNFPGAAGTA